MDGVVDDYKMSFFSSEHVSYDVRGSRSLTAIEITLNSVFPVDGAIASGGMVPLVKALEFKSESRPKYEKWNKSYIASADNKFVLNAYLTDERLDVLTRLMKVKNAWIIFIFKNDTMLLRVDIADPLTSPEQLEKMKEMMVKAGQILELKKGESKRLKSEETRSDAKDISLEVDEEELEKVSALQLEEDHEGDDSEEVAEEKPKEKEKPKKKTASKKTSKSKAKTQK